MHRKKSHTSQKHKASIEADKAEIDSLSRKLKDLEDMYQKVKKANENSKSDYEKHKAKLSKTNRQLEERLVLKEKELKKAIRERDREKKQNENLQKKKGRLGGSSKEYEHLVGSLVKTIGILVGINVENLECAKQGFIMLGKGEEIQYLENMQTQQKKIEDIYFDKFLKKTFLSEKCKKLLREVESNMDTLDDSLALYKDIDSLSKKLVGDLAKKGKENWNDLSVELLLDKGKPKSEAGSCSPPPEEIQMDLPDMSALIVKDHSLMDESAQFCLDEIFMQSSQKKKAVKGDNLLGDNYSSAQKGMQKVFSSENTEQLLLALEGSPSGMKQGNFSEACINPHSPNILSTLNVTGGTVSANKVAQRLLEFSMVLENINIDNETEARILISSAKSINSNILKRLAESKNLEDLESIRTEVEAEDQRLDQEDKRVQEGFAEIATLEKQKKLHEKQQIDLEKRGKDLELKIEEAEKKYSKLSDTVEKMKTQNTSTENDYQEKTNRLEELEQEKEGLEQEIASQKELMSRFVKDEFGLQNEIESSKLKLKEYQQQNSVKEKENQKSTSEFESLQKRLKLVEGQLTAINTENSDLNRKAEGKKDDLESKLEFYKEILSQVVEKQVSLERVQQESRILGEREQKIRDKLRELDEQLFASQRRADQQRREVEDLDVTLQRQTERVEQFDDNADWLGWFLGKIKSASTTSRQVLSHLQTTLREREERRKTYDKEKTAGEGIPNQNNKDEIVNQTHDQGTKPKVISGNELERSEGKESENLYMSQTFETRVGKQQLPRSHSISHPYKAFEKDRSEWTDQTLREEVLNLSHRLSRAKHRLTLLDSENSALDSLKAELASELKQMEEKVKESQILNKFLLEDHSKESLMDSVLDQIRSLRELKMEDKIKTERFKSQLEEFLNRQTEEKQGLVGQGEQLEGMLKKAQTQIEALQLPDFEKMVGDRVDVEKVEKFNRDLKVAEKLGVRRQKLRGSQMMRRSQQYNSTGNLMLNMTKGEYDDNPRPRNSEGRGRLISKNIYNQDTPGEKDNQEKSINVYKPQENRLRQSASFSKNNLMHQNEMLNRYSTNNPTQRDLKAHHNVSASFNLGNPSNLEGFMRGDTNDQSQSQLYPLNRPMIPNDPELAVLKTHWSKIVKDISKIISYLMKSSSLMANNLSHIIGKLMKHDSNFHKLRALIIKFLNESFNRHRRFITEINNYKTCKKVSVKALASCIEKLIDISQIESDSQDTISKSIKTILSSRVSQQNSFRR